MKFTDTHCHLFSEYFNDIPDVIQRAKAEGVSKIIVPATNLTNAKEIVALTENYHDVYCAVGIHPHDTAQWSGTEINEIRKLAQHTKAIAIGEIGLDYYYDFSPRDKQITAFREQLNLAIELNLPVILHNRDSDADMMSIVEEFTHKGLKAHLHCFNGSVNDALSYVRLGHFISFTGNITFKKAEELREVAKVVSLEHLLLETDSPYMTPQPFRGKRNEPQNIPLVAEKLAEIHGVSIEDIARITELNTWRFYGIGEEPKSKITYQIGQSLYVNVTNRCNADCIFCGRKEQPYIHGYNLRLAKKDEPSVEDYIREIGEPNQYKDVVFCGYGEPTIRLDIITELARRIKAAGGKTRLNTNGHGNVINRRDITGELAEVMDLVSISLNSADAESYAQIMRVSPNMYGEMLDFAKLLKAKGGNVVLSIVSSVPTELEKCREIASEIGVPLRERPYF